MDVVKDRPTLIGHICMLLPTHAVGEVSSTVVSQGKSCMHKRPIQNVDFELVYCACVKKIRDNEPENYCGMHYLAMVS